MSKTLYCGFVNPHTHSDVMPHKGLSRSAPFEVWMSYGLFTGSQHLTPEEQAACALVTGLENLEAGTVALTDHFYSPLTSDHVYAVAEAYESLGLRAWVFPNVQDLPTTCFTKEAFPNYPKAIPMDELPERTREWVKQKPTQEQVSAVRELIMNWKGERVQMGLGVDNAVWCSDELLEAVSELIGELNCPLDVHVEESPTQREVSLAQWGMSGIQRLDKFGLLSPRTALMHCVQADDADITLLAQRRVSVCYSPVSNLKLQNGVAPAGKMLAAGINMCLGSDGPNSADDQSLFPVMRFAAALARLNGIQDVVDNIEEEVVRMATINGYKLWFPGSISEDRVEYGQKVTPSRLVWTDMSRDINEVYIDGQPVLEKARAIVKERHAQEIVDSIAKRDYHPERMDLAERCESLMRRYAISK